MSNQAQRISERYTWDDYRTWWDDRRWEIIGGDAFEMTPAPLIRHQWISGRLYQMLSAAFRGQTCRPFYAPIDVKLSGEDVVQPDLVVVCDQNQIKRTHIEGPPALVIEILSESSIAHDRVRKFTLYARSGVKEYWIVTPYPPLVEVFTLDGNAYRLVTGYEQHDTLRSPAFPDLALPLAEVFDFPVEPDEWVAVVKEAHPPYGPHAVKG